MSFKKYKGLYEYVELVCAQLTDETEKAMFRQCYLNTIETTVEACDDGGVFVKTGDIPAMWLRDSSVQVSHYVRLVGQDKDVANLIKNTIDKQLRYILIDPYANAFNKESNGVGHKDVTKQNDNVWERKFELDSLIYPLWLINSYYDYSGDASVFNETFFKAYGEILRVMELETDHHLNSDYSFVRHGEFWYDTLPNDGRGGPCKSTGMVWCAFRPSDDRCQYNYLVPANMFAVATLDKLLSRLQSANIVNPYNGRTRRIIDSIKDGLQKYAITDSAFGKIYAYEVDGLGNKLLMDDANVPSLMSLPYLGYCDIDDEIYQNTRRFVLSNNNPYYYSGKLVSGVGSPHTPENYVWHIGLIIQALTSKDKDEILQIRQILKSTTAQTNFMHEAFHVDDDKQFTRSWFAWANTLYALFVIDCILK